MSIRIKSILSISLLLLIIISCKKIEASQLKNKEVTEEKSTSDVTSEEDILEDYAYKNRDISNTIGFIVFDAEYNEQFDNEKSIVFYNEDNSIWLTIEKADPKYIFEKEKDNKEFDPWLIMVDVYKKIYFRCKDEDDNYYYIYVNDKDQIVKKVRKEDQNIQFETLEEHLGSVIIDNDQKSNPIRQHPNQDSKVIDLIFDGEINLDICNSSKIKGDWLLLTCDDKEIGWIQWRKNNKLNVEIWYAL